ncbi:hypothetical protein H8356DRAFT_1725888 [Neocallimastix lanati (nom. inval.)]|jgi:Leucine-rich repeat (LRR) protein|nr:hypothetical protein H8356DRAFT_1725888 [Neocallimastix sp. JGI-2020a]
MIDYVNQFDNGSTKYEGLSSLPDSFGNLKNLENLYIRNCNIKELPDSMRKLKNLKNLELSSCKLST